VATNLFTAIAEPLKKSEPTAKPRKNFPNPETLIIMGQGYSGKKISARSSLSSLEPVQVLHYGLTNRDVNIVGIHIKFLEVEKYLIYDKGFRNAYINVTLS